jgi:transcriptional regulator with XRE-family HTH domain
MPPKSTIYNSAYKLVVARLKEAREGAGLTQQDVAKKLRRPQSYVSRVEAGQHKLGLVELVQFAHLYEHPLEYFIGHMLGCK